MSEGTGAPSPAPNAPEAASPLRPPLWRLTAILVGGAAAIYGATWIPALGFHFLFQQEVLAQAENPRVRAVLWLRPEREDALTDAMWGLKTVDGLPVRVPPRTAKVVKEETGLLRIENPEAEPRVQLFPRGFLVSLYRSMLEKSGGRDERPLEDAAVLEEVTATSPDAYRFAEPRDERNRYAARILTKLLVIEPLELERAGLAVRDSDSGRAAALAIHYAGGTSRVFVADAHGVAVVLLGPEAPKTWRRAANWMR